MKYDLKKEKKTDRKKRKEITLEIARILAIFFVVV